MDVNNSPSGVDLLKDSNTFHLAVSDIHELEIRKLRKRKYIMHVLFCGAAAILVFWYAYYYTKACKDRKYYSENEQHYQEFNDDVFVPLSKFIWITFLVLAIIFFVVGCSMLNRLRIYFKDFFEKFGCMLWFANVMLTLPLSFRAAFDALYH